MIKFFTPTIDSIITLMKNTLSNRSTNGVSNILMVGGFSNCHMMKEAVQKAFRGKRIIIPDEPELSVLKGAVLFGHRPDYIRSVKGDSLDDDDDDDDDDDGGGCIGK
jgi:activator of 2-hydroxyglutaryl-CoA dehydratase